MWDATTNMKPWWKVINVTLTPTRTHTHTYTYHTHTHTHTHAHAHTHTHIGGRKRGGTRQTEPSAVSPKSAETERNRQRVALDQFSNFNFVRSKGFYGGPLGPSDDHTWANFVKQHWRWPLALRVWVQNVPVCTFKTSPYVRSKLPRVYQHHAYMFQHMCAWCRHTRGRFECTHGGTFLNPHTSFPRFSRYHNTYKTHTNTNTHKHTQTHTNTHKHQIHHDHRERKRKRDKTRQEKTAQDEKTRED